MIDILHIQKVAGIAGAENHLLTLLPQLRQYGYEPKNVRVYSVGKEKGYSEPQRAIEFYRLQQSQVERQAMADDLHQSILEKHSSDRLVEKLMVIFGGYQESKNKRLIYKCFNKQNKYRFEDGKTS